MDKPTPPSNQPASREVKLDHHDSVRNHVHQQVRSEVERLERRIKTLRLVKAPHAAIMISTYEFGKSFFRRRREQQGLVEGGL